MPLRLSKRLPLRLRMLKKAAKTATWMSLAKSYLDAYELPTKNLIVNTPQMEVETLPQGPEGPLF
jgi:hypothetical protein